MTPEKKRGTGGVVIKDHGSSLAKTCLVGKEGKGETSSLKGKGGEGWKEERKGKEGLNRGITQEGSGVIQGG